MDDKESDSSYARLMRIAGARTHTELSDFLGGASLARISDFKRRDAVPGEWVPILEQKGVDVEWLRTGIPGASGMRKM